MKYIKSYQDNTEYDADITKKYPHVGYLKDTKEVIYVKEKTDYSHEYLTFEALESGTFSYNAYSSYSLDGGETWVSLASNTNTPTVNAGELIMFKSTDSGSPNKFSSTGQFNAMGNVISMRKGDSFREYTNLAGFPNYPFNTLFSGCNKLISAKNLALVATGLTPYCYANMFSGCTSLTEAPELPATTMSGYCYEKMFKNCSSLTTAPELKATTLAAGCYGEMFNGCTSLTTAPELPATTLADSCYNSMFDGCTALVSAPELPATTLSNNCYRQMFMHCQSLTSAPDLQATTLTQYCYFNMFNDCRTLNYIKMLATDISASNCLNSWVQNVASTGTFVKDASMTTLPTGANGIPSGWTVIDA